MNDQTVIYGPDYNAEMAKIIDRRACKVIWTFREFRQTWKAYRKDVNTVIVLLDDDRLDYTRVTAYTNSEFETYRQWRVSPNANYDL